MSQYNTKYPEGFEFNVKMVVEEIDNNDHEDNWNYLVICKDHAGDKLMAEWVSLDSLEEMIQTCDPEVKKQRTKLQIKKLQEQIDQLNKELEETE